MIFEGIKIPKVIYKTTSPINGTIEVVQVGNTKKLMAGGIQQSINWDSPVCEKLVWGKTAELLKQECPTCENVLILGLGGGTMYHLISKKIENISIVGVELDPIMVQLAKQYFDLDSIPNLRVITADALRVVVAPEEFGLNKNSFEALTVDIYVGEKYPDLGKSGNFIQAVKDMVRPGGLVIFNRLYLKHHQDEVNTFIEYLEGFFTDVQTLTVAGYTNSDNILIYGRAQQ